MAVLSKDRQTPMRGGETLVLPVAATEKIYAGAIVALETLTGYAVRGKTSTTVRGMGRAEALVDNTSGANGDLTVEIRKGVFRFDNSAGGDQITAADIGSDCYIVNDQTVAKTNGTSTRSVAGKVFDVDSDGVWVKFV